MMTAMKMFQVLLWRLDRFEMMEVSYDNAYANEVLTN